jgi:hypothetical protein
MLIFLGRGGLCDQGGIYRTNGIMQLSILDPGASTIMLMSPKVLEYYTLLVQIFGMLAKIHGFAGFWVNRL